MLLVLSVARSQDRNKQLDLWKQTIGDLIINVYESESLTLIGFFKKLCLKNFTFAFLTLRKWNKE